MHKNRYIGIIPARLNSSRFPEKLLQKINGKSLLQYTWEKAKSYSFLDKLYIATDSEKIAASISCEENIIMTSSRPKSGTERIVEAVKKIPEIDDSCIIFNLQADHPFTSKSTIEKIVNLFEKDPSLEVATAACLTKRDDSIYLPQVVKCVIDKNNNALYFSRSPIPFNQNGFFLHHIGIYAYKKNFLEKLPLLPIGPLEQAEDLEQLRFLENGIQVRVTIVKELSWGIDTLEDLQKQEKAFV